MDKGADILTGLLPHQEEAVRKAVAGDVILAHSLGSGKTLSSIAAIDAIGKPATVFAPASLVENYRKELKKHKKGGPAVTVMSLPTAVSRNYKVPEGNTVVIDEAHALRNQGTKREQYVRDQLEHAGRVIALTGTPSYNNPYDIAQLVNIVSRKDVFPRDKASFDDRYFKDEMIPVPVLARILKGVKAGKKTVLDGGKSDELRKKLREYVDEVDLKRELPSVSTEDVYVGMDPEQLEAYDYVTRNLPSDLLYKLRHNIAPNKTETKRLQAFLNAARQVSNTAEVVDLDAGDSPKIIRAVQNLARFMDENRGARALVYSNYLAAGVEPYARKLEELGLKYNMFTGNMSPGQKKHVVEQYNSGEVPVILGTGSASEGLDLKGTRLIQLLEPHWNNSRLDQVIGRGVRYKSHEGLPEDQRNVKVERFYSTLPETGRLVKRKRSGVDEYLRDRSAEKQELIDAIKKLLKGRDAGNTKAAESKEDRRKRARKLIEDVRRMAAEQGLNWFLVTDGASGISNNGNPAVRNAREAQIKWELEHGADPYEDWGKKAGYEPPWTIDQIRRNLGDEVADRLAKDPAHRWRSDTGIELVHREPTKKELRRIIANWRMMSDEQKRLSDEKSRELFGMTNEENARRLLGGRRSETWESGEGEVESYTKDKTRDHDEIVLRLKSGKKLVISNNTRLGIRVEPDEGDEIGYNGYRIDGTNVVHKVHPSRRQRGGWLDRIKSAGFTKKADPPNKGIHDPNPAIREVTRQIGFIPQNPRGSGYLRDANDLELYLRGQRIANDAVQKEYGSKWEGQDARAAARFGYQRAAGNIETGFRVAERPYHNWMGLRTSYVDRTSAPTGTVAQTPDGENVHYIGNGPLARFIQLGSWPVNRDVVAHEVGHNDDLESKAVTRSDSSFNRNFYQGDLLAWLRTPPVKHEEDAWDAAGIEPGNSTREAGLDTYRLLEAYMKAGKPEAEFKADVIPLIDKMHDVVRRDAKKPEELVKEFDGKEPIKFVYDMDTALKALEDDNLDYKEVPYFETEDGKFAQP